MEMAANIKKIIYEESPEIRTEMSDLHRDLYIFERSREIIELFKNNPGLRNLNDVKREQIKHQIELSEKSDAPILLSNSNEKCPRCGANNTACEERQMRSADEAQTLFFLCLSCNNKWKI